MPNTLNWSFDRYITSVPEGLDHTADEARYEALINGRRAFLFLCEESNTAAVHVQCGSFFLRKHTRTFQKKDTLEKNFETASVLAWDILNKDE